MAKEYKFKLCVIIVYFGEWPEFFDLHLKSCSYNGSVDFIFITDCGLPNRTYSNTKFVEYSLKKFGDLIDDKLGINSQLPKPYKICDLKPAFGLLFEKLIRDYDFWGFADIDLVYGDIRQFATDEILEQNDIFCVRKEYVSGGFTIIRNTRDMNRIFMQSPDWKRVFESGNVFSFCECNMKWRFLVHGGRIWDAETEIGTFTEVVFDAIKRGEIKGFFKTIALESIHSIVEIAPKSVMENGASFVLFHFVTAKGHSTFTYPKWKGLPDNYYIKKNGFFLKSELKGFRHMIAINWLRIIKKFVKKRKKRYFS